MIQLNESGQRVSELLYRNLQDVFGEADASRRLGAIEEFWNEDAILYVPPGIVEGRDAIDMFAGDPPQFVYTPPGEPQVLQDAGRLPWGSGPRGEAPDYTGCDVIIVRDGRIAALHVFLDEAADELSRSALDQS
jgi:hypothetical protein